MQGTEKDEKAQESDGNPPAIFGTWKNLYLLVIGNLVFLIVLFYLFTLAYQ